jgi:hypothetical protein
VFGLPGLGREAVQAIANQNLPIIMGITILSAALIVAANLVVDVVQAVIDPRVRLVTPGYTLNLICMVSRSDTTYSFLLFKVRT